MPYFHLVGVARVVPQQVFASLSDPKHLRGYVANNFGAEKSSHPRTARTAVNIIFMTGLRLPRAICAVRIHYTRGYHFVPALLAEMATTLPLPRVRI
jgi:hypothetical protein